MQTDRFSSGIIAISLIASIAIAWTIILLASHGATLASTAQSRAAIGTVSNLASKGDRLVGAAAKSEHLKSDLPPAKAKDVAKIPLGCDAAFSKLIREYNFAARCITSIEARTSVKAG
jgi:hypothetical protein